MSRAAIISFYSFPFSRFSFTSPFSAEKHEKSFGRRRVQKEPVSGPPPCFFHLSSIRTQILAVTRDALLTRACTDYENKVYNVCTTERKKKETTVDRRSNVVQNFFHVFFFCIFLVFPRIRSIISNTIDRRSTTIERQAIVRWRRKEISAAVPATGRWYSVCSRVGSLGNNK